MSLLDTAFADNIPWIVIYLSARSPLIFTREGAQPTAEYQTGAPVTLTLTKGKEIVEPVLDLWSPGNYSSTGPINTQIEPNSPEDSDPNFFQSIVIVQPGLLSENYLMVINGAFSFVPQIDDGATIASFTGQARAKSAIANTLPWVWTFNGALQLPDGTG